MENIYMDQLQIKIQKFEIFILHVYNSERSP